MRNILFTSAGGTVARVRFTNVFGSQSLEIGRGAIGVTAGGATVGAVGNVPLTFAGRQSVVIASGGEATSDPVHLTIRPLEHLAVSVFLPGDTGAPTEHRVAKQTNYVAPGDHALDTSAAAFTTRLRSWYFVAGVDVRGSSRELGTVVALGDSITDGFGSRADANARWPNDLARRLDARRGASLSVVNEGIGGNQLSSPDTSV